jgi:transglutaminase-like putative cysteine protease
MTVRYTILHRTRYSYAYPVTLSHHVAHLLLRDCPRQQTQESRLELSPPPASRSERFDYFGNALTSFTIEQSHDELSVLMASDVIVDPLPLPDAAATPAWELVAEILRAPTPSLRFAEGGYCPLAQGSLEIDPESLSDAVGFLHASPMIPLLPELRPLAEACFPPGETILNGAMTLTSLIFHRFTYDSEATDISTPLSQVIAKRRGVCQDFAHVMIGALRSLGLAARYVSGYLLTGNSVVVEDDAKATADTTGLIGADATHAWVSVWVPGYGWVDLDPTNNKFAIDEHVVAAWGRDFDDVSPIKGVMVGGGEHTITVEVAVRPHDGLAPPPVPHLTVTLPETWPPEPAISETNADGSEVETPKECPA